MTTTKPGTRERGATTAAPMIDFDALVGGYQGRLTSMLRGFRSGDEGHRFLETWVPDEDDERSILGLLEAAGAEGLGGLRIRFASATVARLTEARLVSVAKSDALVTHARLEAAGSAVELVVSFGTPPASHALEEDHRKVTRGRAAPAAAEAPRTTGSGIIAKTPVRGSGDLYDVALAELGARRHLWGGREASPNHHVAREGDAVLVLSWNDEGQITEAFHGGTSPEEEPLYEAFCRMAVGLPVQEVGDHGVLRLEHVLRAHSLARPVPGIVNPAAADPRFGRLLALVRRITGTLPRRDGRGFEPAPQSSWAHLPEAQRLTRSAEAVDALLARRGLPEGTVTCEHFEHHGARLVVAFQMELPAGSQGPLLFDLEAELKAKVEPTLTVYVAERSDQSPIRRLTKPKEARS